MSYYNKFPSLFGGSGLNPYTKTYINAMTTAPTTARQKVINDFVNGLIDDGLWDKFDAFYIFKMHDAQAARINLINPGTFDLTLSGSPTFTADVGYAGGTSAYLQTSVNMSTFSKFTRDDGAIGCYAENAVSVNTGAIGNGSNKNEIRPHSPGLGIVAMCNASYVAGEAIRAVANSIGHTVVVRPNSTQYFHVRNGAQLGATNTRASVAVTEASFKACGGINGNNTTLLSFVHAGSSLTVAECADLYNRILTYRTDY